MDGSSSIGDVLAEVGPRLRRIPAERDVTLTELATATGISKSTPSRLSRGSASRASSCSCRSRWATGYHSTSSSARPHDNYEWLYVLSGELRLIIAGHDITMQPGEVAEFDTRVPHWFGAAGDRAVEILSILGREGERIHVRAAPRRKSANRR